MLQAKIAEKARMVAQPAMAPASIPAPILGLNARDALSDMDPRYALVMDNYFPDGSRVRLRNGTSDHATGFTAPVEYLHSYAKGDQITRLAFSNGAVYNVTSAGTIGVPLASGFSSNRWFGVNAGANGGETGIYTNGVDPAQQYDGTTFGASGITGPTKPTGTAVSKKRVWLIEKGTGEAWYGPPEGVTGAFAKFDIGSVHPDGGDLIAIGNVTLDGGEDQSDLTVFIMRSGAALLYAGTDPGDAAAWSLRGVWKPGEPIGERCLVPFADDLVLISTVGFLSLKRFTGSGKLAGVPISDEINPLISDNTLINSNLYGWTGIYHSKRRQLLFNSPLIENASSDQYVMNSIYQTWARFRGWDAICFMESAGELYMGTSNKVLVAGNVGADSGDQIVGRIQTAWNYFGNRGRSKHFKQYRPNIQVSDASIKFAVGIGVDFRDPVITSGVTVPPGLGGRWNVTNWNEDKWVRRRITLSDWRGAGAIGHNASVSFETQTLSQSVEILATDFINEVGRLV